MHVKFLNTLAQNQHSNQSLVPTFRCLGKKSCVQVQHQQDREIYLPHSCVLQVYMGEESEELRGIIQSTTCVMGCSCPFRDFVKYVIDPTSRSGKDSLQFLSVPIFYLFLLLSFPMCLPVSEFLSLSELSCLHPEPNRGEKSSLVANFEKKLNHGHIQCFSELC